MSVATPVSVEPPAPASKPEMTAKEQAEAQAPIRWQRYVTPILVNTMEENLIESRALLLEAKQELLTSFLTSSCG